MKRLIAVLGLITLLLCGCGADSDKVMVVAGETLLYSEENGEYNLYFILRDLMGNEVTTPAKVSIRIEDELGNLVYKGKKKITEEDFIFTDQVTFGDHHFARITIPAEDLKPGQSVYGTVKFKVSRLFSFSFKKTCQAEACLPLREFLMDCPQINEDLPIRDPFWHSVSTYRVDSLTMDWQPYMENSVNLLVNCRKLEKAKGTGADVIRYDVTDRKGEVVQGGELYLGNYRVGEKITASILLNHLLPGEKYSISFSSK